MVLVLPMVPVFPRIPVVPVVLEPALPVTLVFPSHSRQYQSCQYRSCWYWSQRCRSAPPVVPVSPPVIGLSLPVPGCHHDIASGLLLSPHAVITNELNVLSDETETSKKSSLVL